MSDFMYACICGALVASATAASDLRTRRSSGEIIAAAYYATAMSFFVSRAASGRGRADVFARGDTAVLVVANGAAAELALARVREATLDLEFDLLSPPRWSRLLGELGPEIAIVVLAPGALVHAFAGDCDAWLIGPAEVTRLGSPDVGTRGPLVKRLVVATDGLFRHAPEDGILRVVRAEKFGAVADALVALAGPAEDVAVLVAEP